MLHYIQNCPLPIESFHSNLSSNVSQNLKAKIISSVYIDLALLLGNTSLHEDAEKQICFNEKGELITKGYSKANAKINSISKWTDAFIVYICIYTTAHPNSFQGLLKYMHGVRLGASRCNEGDNGWKKYDEQFRLRRSVDTSISWSKIDYELWLMFMQHSTQPRTITSFTTATHNKCYNFNFKGSCDRLVCQCMHKCIICGEGHLQYSCPLSSSSFQAQRGTHPPQFRPPGQSRPRFQPPLPISTSFRQTFRPKRFMDPRKNTY